MSDKTAINAAVEARWNELIREGKHGIYETLFRIVHEQRAAAAEAMREAAIRSTPQRTSLQAVAMGDNRIGEARNDTKFARIDGKVDLVLAKIEGYSGLVNTRFDASDKQTAMMREDIRGVKEDTRAARQNVWTVAGIVIATILAVVAIGVAVVAIMPPIYDAGTKLRDTVREEVKTQTDKPKAEPQPPAPTRKR